MTDLDEIVAVDFRVQEGPWPYWQVWCPQCRCSWYLPQDPARRTRAAVDLLLCHVEAHQIAAARRKGF
jgi:hypothetical protein